MSAAQAGGKGLNVLALWSCFGPPNKCPTCWCRTRHFWRRSLSSAWTDCLPAHSQHRSLPSSFSLPCSPPVAQQMFSFGVIQILWCPSLFPSLASYGQEENLRNSSEQQQLGFNPTGTYVVFLTINFRTFLSVVSYNSKSPSPTKKWTSAVPAGAKRLGLSSNLACCQILYNYSFSLIFLTSPSQKLEQSFWPSL